jgi:hypothetical protein
MYGSFLETFTGYCRVTKNEMSCMTKDQANEFIQGLMFSVFIIYLIYYRLTR